MRPKTYFFLPENARSEQVRNSKVATLTQTLSLSNVLNYTKQHYYKLTTSNKTHFYLMGF